MQAKPKSNTVVTSEWDLATGIIKWLVAGATIKDPLTLDVRTLVGATAYDALTNLGKQGTLHGVNQRVSNRTAISRDKNTGASATPDQKRLAMEVLIAHWMRGGTWEMDGDGLAPLVRPHLYAAIAKVRNRAVEEVARVYQDKSDEVLRTMLTVKDINAEYIRLTAPATESDKAKELLAEMDAAFAKAEAEAKAKADAEASAAAETKGGKKK